jgi:(p)ppGpp synthase/HD superfamily hydrolase
MTGYSDRINHALAFAAKHHDQQVRKGTRLPYLTQPANVAIILTRFGCDDETVVAGILHDVVADGVREAWSVDALTDRIGHKFGSDVLSALLSIVPRRTDDAGVDLGHDERREDVLRRLSAASESARWVGAADALHGANTVLWDLRRTAFPETVWARFSAGRDGTVRWYARYAARLREVGFEAPIVGELSQVAKELAER